jgi:transcriptional regulator with XRE-family HTH domain
MATIKDVARQAGVSVATVSRVLNNKDKVNEKTRAAVEKALREPDYHPNDFARALVKTNESRIVAMISVSPNHPFFGELIFHIEEALSDRGYKLLLLTSYMNEEKEKKCAELINGRMIDGLIIGSYPLADPVLLNLPLPAVAVETAPGEGIPYVMSDEYQGGVLGTRHLIAKGCKNLVMIGGTTGPEGTDRRMNERERGFVEVCEKNGINYTAFIEGNSICNIVEFKAKSFLFVERYIIIEEEFSDNGKTVNKFGLLSSGGTRLLDSKYDKLEVYHPYFIIATIDGYKQLILPNAKILLDKCDNISYGRYYDEEEDKDLYYFSVNDKYVNIYYEQSQDVGSLFAGDYDEEYFACDKDSSNKYFALVEGGKTKLVDINGDEIIPPVISAEYRVITDKYGEGIVGVSKVIQKEYSDGTPYSQTYYGYINADGKLLCDLIFDGIDKFKDGVARAYYDSANSRTYCELDKQGKIFYRHTDHGDSEPMDNTWADLIGDAYEGDPDARWNTD